MTALWHHVSERFGRATSEVVRARRFVAEALAGWGLDAEREALELAVSELVSNAIEHGRGRVEVRLDAGDDEVRLSVTDEGGGEPVMRQPPPGPGEIGGWGLRFVDELADDWGAVSRPGRTEVWLVKHVRQTCGAVAR
jgi:anti-sigma regulatory factor (Ser/Thr protein kinase)